MPEITMYCTATCPYCIRAEMLLHRRGVSDIHKIFVDRDRSLRAVMTQRTGRRTVPQIYIGERYIGGYAELAALDRAGELVPLLQA